MPRDHVTPVFIAFKNAEEAFKIGYLTNVIQLSFGVLIELVELRPPTPNTPNGSFLLNIYSKVKATGDEAVSEYEKQLKR